MPRHCCHRFHHRLAQARPSGGTAGLARDRGDFRDHARALLRMPGLRGRRSGVRHRKEQKGGNLHEQH